MKDVFLDLCYAKPALRRLMGRGKLYDSLIEVLLGIGEEVEVPFLRRYAGLGRYYVHRVMHRYEEDRAIITVRLQTERYNQHYEYLKDRAEFEEAIDFRTLIMGNRREIEKLLREEYPNG